MVCERTLERTLNIFVCLCHRNFWSTEAYANQTKRTKATTEKLVDVYDSDDDADTDGGAAYDYAHNESAIAAKRNVKTTQ